MRKLLDYVKEHMAMSAVFLGVAIMLIAGIVMIIVNAGGEDNVKQLSDIESESSENATDSEGNPIEPSKEGEDTPSADNPNGDISDGTKPSGDSSSGDNEGSGSLDGTDEGGGKPGNDTPSSDKSDSDKPSGDSSDSDSSESDSSNNDSSSGDSNKPSGDSSDDDSDDGDSSSGGSDGDSSSSDKPSGDSDKPDSEKPSDDTPSDEDMTEEEKFLTKNKIEYVTNSDGTVTITGGSLYGDVVIPATIEGKKTIVGERAFYSYGSVCEVTSLVIKSVEVKSNAFSNCTKLVSVTFSEEVERLGENAFSDCDSLTGVTFLGNKVTEIPKGLFNRCTKLSSIALPSSITRVNASFVTSGNYYTSQAGISKPSEVDYTNIVPELTVYISSEPSEVWTENNSSGYVKYGSLLEGLSSVRKANVKVVND